MKSGFSFLSLLFLLFCHKPDEYDFEVETGKIIKKVACDNNSDSEYWLVQFVPTKVSNKSYGATIDLDSRVYDNVVLTDYDLEIQSADTSDIYLLHFNLKEDPKITCSIPSNESVIIPSVNIKRVSIAEEN